VTVTHEVSVVGMAGQQQMLSGTDAHTASTGSVLVKKNKVQKNLL